ncbi:MAG: DUF3787 domain-containing protein [Clostridiales bacterium]|nr:DUF3787 domain-containing protein [Clostridiales bacterium]
MAKKNLKNVSPDYATQAISDSSGREKNTGLPLPSRQAITEAKEWVDGNEK